MRTTYLLVVPLAAILACSGSTATLGNGTDGGSGADTGARGDAATGSDSSSGMDGSVVDSTANGDGPTTGDGGSQDGNMVAACPDLSGAYTGGIVASGQGCGNLNVDANECIQQMGCHIVFLSTSLTGTPAVTGEAQIDNVGAFMGAGLVLGTNMRTGCTGQWDAQTQTLTVDCGGTGSAQSCTVTMTRKQARCG